jgi:hypothetical protein
MSGERSVVGTTISGDGRAVPGTVVSSRDGAGTMVSGAQMTVPGEWVVPLSAESHHLEREFLDAHQKLVIVRRLANVRECGWRSSLGDVVCTVGSSVQLNLWMASKSGLYFSG